MYRLCCETWKTRLRKKRYKYLNHCHVRVASAIRLSTGQVVIGLYYFVSSRLGGTHSLWPASVLITMDSDEKLIYLVQKYECLFNPKAKNYSDKHSKNNAWEIVSGEMKLTGNLGEVLIRCNNVLYVRGAEEEDEEGEMKE
ncbi:hypothetical protein PYW07_013667 [Mythimna separata]|uniref:MADF domain-containing protein n=1 Tax=Mythimna separata TaxID=271217 RepID=A0AAD8DNU6_MYTSE|nr:hypothetical protein PYW07_013667 [Mythimna separata]